MAVKLKAKQRKDLKGSVTKALRQAGEIPAIVYGKDKDSTPVSVNNLDLIRTVREEGQNAIISLEIEDDKTVEVMLYDYQMHPVRDQITHVDFYIVDLTEEMDVEVTVRLEGEAAGARSGGVLQQPLFELQVRATPRAIPEEIVIDVSSLEIGDTITVSDIEVDGDYVFLDEPDTAVATVLPPEEEVEETADVDLSIEPEVVGAEDKEEEEED